MIVLAPIITNITNCSIGSETEKARARFLHITHLFIDLNEDDFLSSHNAHTLQGKKLQHISYQVM